MKCPASIGSSRHTQAGAALLTAMVIVTLVATLASAMVWQQWRAVQVEAAERAHTQSAWILTGALDWARLILREDGKTVDHLGEPWATPLAEARLSSFLAADKDHTDDAPDAFLSGSIVDAQSHYNLRNLVGADGKLNEAEQKVLQRLCDTVGVAPQVALRIASGLRDALAPVGAPGRPDDPPLLPHSVAQLAWLGIDEDARKRLAPYVVLLPTGNVPVNVNTAPREVIAAVIDELDLAGAERLVQARQRSFFKTAAEVQPLLPGSTAPPAGRIGVNSRYFEVYGRLRLGDKVLEERSLVERRGSEVVLLLRERVNSRETSG